MIFRPRSAIMNISFCFIAFIVVKTIITKDIKNVVLPPEINKVYLIDRIGIENPEDVKSVKLINFKDKENFLNLLEHVPNPKTEERVHVICDSLVDLELHIIDDFGKMVYGNRNFNIDINSNNPKFPHLTEILTKFGTGDYVEVLVDRTTTFKNFYKYNNYIVYKIKIKGMQNDLQIKYPLGVKLEKNLNQYPSCKSTVELEEVHIKNKHTYELQTNKDMNRLLLSTLFTEYKFVNGSNNTYRLIKIK